MKIQINYEGKKNNVNEKEGIVESKRGEFR